MRKERRVPRPAPGPFGIRIPHLRSVSREDYICSKLAGKSVLHLGCADWPLTQRKLKDGSLLHARMLDISPDVVGVDASQEGIALLSKTLRGEFVRIDGEQLQGQLNGRKFDVVIAGEIIEHVRNPGNFLDSIAAVTHKDSIVVITTPNYCPIKKIPLLLFRHEIVHPDHVCYYSYSTLYMTLEKSGYEDLEWRTYWFARRRSSKIFNALFSEFSLVQPYADGLCVTCRPPREK